ncbi:hypothetical protein ACU8V7_11270 [Zobellia nedashkovskayae]
MLLGLKKNQKALISSDDSRSNDDFNSSKNNPTEATGIALTENRSNNLKPNTENPENSTSKTNVDDNITESPDELAITEDGKETEKKSIFDEIETEEEIATADKNGRWSAGPNIAPVYYNALGEGLTR